MASLSLKKVIAAWAVVSVACYLLFTAVLTKRMVSIDKEYDAAYQTLILGKREDYDRANAQLDREKAFFQTLHKELDDKDEIIAQLREQVGAAKKGAQTNQVSQLEKSDPELLDICRASESEISARAASAKVKAQERRKKCEIGKGSDEWRVLQYNTGHYAHLAAAHLIGHLLENEMVLESQAIQSHFMQQCCSRMVVAVHSKHGAMFRLNIPDVVKGSGGNSYRRVCFVRRWDSWTGHVRVAAPSGSMPRTSAHFVGWLQAASEAVQFIRMMSATLNALRDAQAKQTFQPSVTVIIYCTPKRHGAKFRPQTSDRIAIGVHKRCDRDATFTARKLRALWTRRDAHLSIMTIVVDGYRVEGAVKASLETALASAHGASVDDIVSLVDHRADCPDAIVESILRASQTGASAPILPSFQFGAYILLSAQRKMLLSALRKSTASINVPSQAASRVFIKQQIGAPAQWSTLNASGWEVLLARPTTDGNKAFPQGIDLSLRAQLVAASDRERKVAAANLVAGAACEFYDLVAMLEMEGTRVNKVQSCGSSTSTMSGDELRVAKLILSRCGLAAQLAISSAEEISSPAHCFHPMSVRDTGLSDALQSAPRFNWYARSFSPSFGEIFEGAHKSGAVARALRPLSTNVTILNEIIH